MTQRGRPQEHHLGQVLWESIRALSGRMRRNTEPRIFLLEAYTVVYSFTASAFYTDRPSAIEDPMGLLRLAVPALAVLAVLLLRNAWAGDGERAQVASTIDVTLAFGLAVFLEAILSAHFPALVLPRWRPTQGSWAGWLFLAELRMLFPPRSRHLRQPLSAMGQPMYLEEIRWRAEELRRDLRRRNLWIYSIAAAILALFGVGVAQTRTATARTGSVLIVAGTVYIIWRVWTSGSPRSEPIGSNFNLYRDFCRSELDRQRKLLRRIRYSYIGLLIPGLLLVLAGSMVYVYVILMLCFSHRRADSSRDPSSSTGTRRGHFFLCRAGLGGLLTLPPPHHHCGAHRHKYTRREKE